MTPKPIESLDEILEQLQFANNYADNREPYLTNQRNQAKQALYKDMLELIDKPVYEMKDHPSKEFEVGYNDMVNATRILLLQIKSDLANYFGVKDD